MIYIEYALKIPPKLGSNKPEKKTSCKVKSDCNRSCISPEGMQLVIGDNDV